MSELIGRIQVIWDGLMPRERVLVGVAVGALAITILIVGIVLPIQNATESATDGARASERQLDMTRRMKREWDGLHARLARVETRIQDSRNQPNLLTLLESLAAQVGVKPASMENANPVRANATRKRRSKSVSRMSRFSRPWPISRVLRVPTSRYRSKASA